MDDSGVKRPTANITNERGRPIERGVYAEVEREKLERHTGGDELRPFLTFDEAEVAADLLEELGGVYRGEELGALADELAHRLCRRLGL